MRVAAPRPVVRLSDDTRSSVPVQSVAAEAVLMRRMLYSGCSKKPVLSSIFMRIFGAPARGRHRGTGARCLRLPSRQRVLPVCQPVAEQNRVPLAQFDVALGHHFNVIRPGDMVGGDEGRQALTRPLEVGHDTGGGTQRRLGQFSGGNMRRIERRKDRAFFNLAAAPAASGSTPTDRGRRAGAASFGCSSRRGAAMTLLTEGLDWQRRGNGEPAQRARRACAALATARRVRTGAGTATCGADLPCCGARSTFAVGGGSTGTGCTAAGRAAGASAGAGVEGGGVPAPSRPGLTRRGGRASAAAVPAVNASTTSNEPLPNCPRCD
jgi:hypothetical protein